MFPAGTSLMAMYGQGVTRGRVAILGIDAPTNQACAAIEVKSRKWIATDGGQPWRLQLTQTIKVSLGVDEGGSAPMLAFVKIELAAKAFQEDAPENTADFSAAYEARCLPAWGNGSRDCSPI